MKLLDDKYLNPMNNIFNLHDRLIEKNLPKEGFPHAELACKNDLTKVSIGDIFKAYDVIATVNKNTRLTVISSREKHEGQHKTQSIALFLCALHMIQKFQDLSFVLYQVSTLQIKKKLPRP